VCLVWRISVAEFPWLLEAYESATPDPNDRAIEVALPLTSSSSVGVCPMVISISPAVVGISLCCPLGWPVEAPDAIWPIPSWLEFLDLASCIQR